jgi:hypothetical protein
MENLIKLARSRQPAAPARFHSRFSSGCPTLLLLLILIASGACDLAAQTSAGTQQLPANAAPLPSTRAFTPTAMATAKPTSGPPVVGTPAASVTKFYHDAAGCGPLEVTINVPVSGSDNMISGVEISYRLTQKDGSSSSEYKSQPMTPLSNGLWTRTIHANESELPPGYTRFPNGLLQFYFIATDAGDLQARTGPVDFDIPTPDCASP